MIDPFFVAATGLQAQEQHVSNIANNLSNWNTTGFKKSRVNFEDLLYRELAASSGLIGNPEIRHPLGLGVGISNIAKIFTQGEIRTTERELDLAIQGAGFFEVMLPDGSLAYTRAGALQVNPDGFLVNPDGYRLNPDVQLPPDTISVIITGDGLVFAELPDSAEPVEVARIELASFVNPAGLTPAGDNLLLPSARSGDVFYGEPGESSFGRLAQGFLEGSNVDMSEELTNLVLAQRGYEMNARVLQAADEIMNIINNLRR